MMITSRINEKMCSYINYKYYLLGKGYKRSISEISDQDCIAEYEKESIKLFNAFIQGLLDMCGKQKLEDIAIHVTKRENNSSECEKQFTTLKFLVDYLCIDCVSPLYSFRLFYDSERFADNTLRSFNIETLCHDCQNSYEVEIITLNIDRELD